MKQHEARFGGIARLYSAAGAERLRRAHVCVVGVGGVGSWAVEGLARSGIGQLTLVDLDDVCISNVNRQVPALTGEFGKPKVEVMACRVTAINPECRVHSLQSFFLAANAQEILQAGFDYVVDAIDTPSLKALLIQLCRQRGLPVLTTGGAGGRRDPTAVEVQDLAFSTHDRLMRQVRKYLRRNAGFPAPGKPFGVECVISREPPVYAHRDGSVCADKDPGTDLRLDCTSGYGTASFVTGTFGFVAAARVVAVIASGTRGPDPGALPPPAASVTAPAPAAPTELVQEQLPPS
jgi:tRNA A37 threonylcarbamoyladenosine dehydratase